jgi:predicted DNA-binding protein
MSKDPHLKRQKQIRMSDEVRERFDAAVAESGMTGEEFIVSAMDALDRKNDLTQKDVLDWIRRSTK